MRTRAGVLLVVLVCLIGLTACASRPSENTTSSGSSAETLQLDHPPYTDGAGSVSGTFERSTIATYPAGSLQKPIPFNALIVGWDDGGTARRTEFLLNGSAELIVGSTTEPDATPERIAEALASAGTGASATVEYVGSDLLPSMPTTAPADFPYATVTRIVVE